MLRPALAAASGDTSRRSGTPSVYCHKSKLKATLESASPYFSFEF
jgi:hypothetical protein